MKKIKRVLEKNKKTLENGCIFNLLKTSGNRVVESCSDALQST